MDRYSGRVALVTGASGGIGAVIAEDLVRAGMQVVGAARRVQRVQELADRLAKDGAKGKLHAVQADVSSEDDILRLYQWVDKNLGGVSVVVNNAGVYASKPAHDMDPGEIPKLLHTNIGGVMNSCRNAVSSMKKHEIKDGHIVNINSVLGHEIPRVPGMSVAVYAGSKHAVTAFTKGLRHDVKAIPGYRIRVTNVSPGGVDTDMPPPEYREMIKSVPDAILKPKDVSNAVLYAVSSPPGVEILEVTLNSTGCLL